MTPATDAVREALIARLGVKHCYLAPSDVAEARRLLALTEAASQPREGNGLAWRLDRIREDGGPLTASDKGILREAAAALTQRPPEQAGAVPAGATALVYCVMADTHSELTGSQWLVGTFPTADEASAAAIAEREAKPGCETTIYMGSIALSAAPTPPDAGPGEIPAEMVDATMLGEVMQDAWGEICDDAGSHPSDMRHGRGTVLFYSPGHWTDLIALRLSERLTPKAPPQTPPDVGIGSDGAGERVTQLVAAVEAGDFDALDKAADQWAESAGVQRMMNAIASVFEKHASQGIMDRFREKLAAQMHLAFVEGAAQGVLQIKPALATQPGDGGRA